MMKGEIMCELLDELEWFVISNINEIMEESEDADVSQYEHVLQKIEEINYEREQ